MLRRLWAFAPVLLVSSAAVSAQPVLPVDLVSGAQEAVQHHVSLHIEAYARASTDREALAFDLRGGTAEATATVSYATNYAVGQRLLLTVEGEMDGIELLVTPSAEGPLVERVARAGSAGQARPLVFREAGTQAFVEGVGQVVARQGVRYTARAREGAAVSGPRTIVVTYTLSE